MKISVSPSSLTFGDKGIPLTISAGGYDLTGYTCELLATPGPPPPIGVGIALAPVSVDPGGLTAEYLPTGVDFQQAGPWSLQLNATNGDGSIVITSEPSPFYVFPKY